MCIYQITKVKKLPKSSIYFWPNTDIFKKRYMFLEKSTFTEQQWDIVCLHLLSVHPTSTSTNHPHFGSIFFSCATELDLLHFLAPAPAGYHLWTLNHKTNRQIKQVWFFFFPQD